METALFRQFEKKFGKSWFCSCGGAFQTGWLGSVSIEKGGATAHYFCQLCGREQIFFVSIREKAADADSLVEIPGSQLTSDDVLDIKQELAQASARQIKGLAKAKESAKVTLSKIDHREAA